MPTASVSTPRPRAVAPGVRGWRNSLFLLFAALGILTSSLAARIPTISLELSLTTAEVGLLLSGMAIGSIVGLVAAGHVVSILGARRTFQIFFTVLAVAISLATFGIAVFGSFALTFAALIVVGGTMGTCDVAMNVSGAANERAIGRTVMPVYHAFFSIGTVAGAGLGSLAEAFHVPLEVHVTTIAVIMIVVVLVATRFLLSETAVAIGEQEHPVSTWRSRLAIWRDPRTHPDRPAGARVRLHRRFVERLARLRHGARPRYEPRNRAPLYTPSSLRP